MVVALSQVANQYFQEEEPWVLVKPSKPDEKKKSTKAHDPQRCGTVINIAANVALLLVTLGEPYMPSLTAKVRILARTLSHHIYIYIYICLAAMRH